MKRLITGALAAITLVGGTAGVGVGAAAQAAPHNDYGRYGQGQSYGQSSYDRSGYDHRNGYGQQRWSRGQYVPQSYWGRERFVDYRSYRLRQPPRGYGWVRDDRSGDFLMIALATGLIANIASH